MNTLNGKNCEMCNNPMFTQMFDFYKNIYTHIMNCHPMAYNFLTQHTDPKNSCHYFPNMGNLGGFQDFMKSNAGSSANPMMHFNPMMYFNPMINFGEQNPAMQSFSPSNFMTHFANLMQGMKGCCNNNSSAGNCCEMQSCSTKYNSCNKSNCHASANTSCRCSKCCGNMYQMMMGQYTDIIGKVLSMTDNVASHMRSCNSQEDFCNNPNNSGYCSSSYTEKMQGWINNWSENFGKFHGEMVRMNEQAMANIKLVSQNLKLIQDKMNECMKKSESDKASEKEKNEKGCKSK